MLAPQGHCNFRDLPKETGELEKAENELAVTISCHSAILTIDHLGEVISKNATGSTLEKIKLHRRKCTKILTKVVAPVLK